MKKRRIPLLALSLSAFVFPGVGQIYNKQYKKGIIILLCCGLLLIFIVVPSVMSLINYLSTCTDIESINAAEITSRITTGNNTIFSIVMTIIWLFSTIDAFMFARKDNLNIEKLH